MSESEGVVVDLRQLQIPDYPVPLINRMTF